ncbi:MAG: STAS/SEC14 domain-containing protein [Micavibrio sp.]
MTQTIFPLPNSKEGTICLRLTGMITPEDFMKYFDAAVEQAIEKHGYYNLFIYYDPAFEGWSREAADLSFKCISKCSPKAKRLAYVNAPDSRVLMMKMLSPMMQAEIQYFEDEEKDKALSWVLSYTP